MIGSNHHQHWRETAAQQTSRLLVRQQFIEQPGFVNFEQYCPLPQFNSPRLSLPLHQRILHILRYLHSRPGGLLQHLLNCLRVHSHLDGSRDTRLRYAILRDMFQAQAFRKTIQLDQ
ncbi:MAG: hypothetical protein AUG82_03705 [Ktedonobacter sp. 13_1_20CM_4_53_11]|nr:MAG: hypothetical protein AUG82_03705 [Ktedonobacter sp. 13_1_20CM_4_53_11]